MELGTAIVLLVLGLKGIALSMWIMYKVIKWKRKKSKENDKEEKKESSQDFNVNINL